MATNTRQSDQHHQSHNLPYYMQSEVNSNKSWMGSLFGWFTQWLPKKSEEIQNSSSNEGRTKFRDYHGNLIEIPRKTLDESIILVSVYLKIHDAVDKIKSSTLSSARTAIFLHSFEDIAKTLKDNLGHAGPALSMLINPNIVIRFAVIDINTYLSLIEEVITKFKDHQEKIYPKNQYTDYDRIFNMQRVKSLFLNESDTLLTLSHV